MAWPGPPSASLVADASEEVPEGRLLGAERQSAARRRAAHFEERNEHVTVALPREPLKFKKPVSGFQV